MPSWSGRNPSVSPASSTGASGSARVVPSGPSLALQTERTAPVLIPDASVLPLMNHNHSNHLTATSSFNQGHSRSFSHPFTSPFGSRSKRRNKSIFKRDFLDSDDDDDDDFGVVGYSPGRLSTSPRKEPPRAGPEDDFLTGKCMTCSSTVRWPRHLKVFRCTSCLTVNDLEPLKESRDPEHGHPTKSEKSSVQRKAMPLSVERTKVVIDSCVSSYLKRLLDGLKSPSEENSREGRPRDIRQDGYLSHSRRHSSRHLSPNSAVGLRSRSPSAARPAGRPDVKSGISSYLTPTPVPRHTEERNIQMRSRSHSDIPSPQKGDRLSGESGRSPLDRDARNQDNPPLIFKELEEYVMSSFKGCDCLNNSFISAPPPPRRASEDHPPTVKPEPSAVPTSNSTRTVPIFEPDPKILLLGDVAENSSWWMNDWAQTSGLNPAYSKDKHSNAPRTVASRSPRINWAEVAQWYQLILTAGMSWVEQWMAMKPVEASDEEKSARGKKWESIDMSTIEREVAEARLHLQRTLLKATENLLKRPRRPLTKPEDIRFLFILLENPVLYSSRSTIGTGRSERRPSNSKDIYRPMPRDGKSPSRKEPPIPIHSGSRRGGPGHHSGLIKRIMGLMSNLPDSCHHYLISWYSRFPREHFERIVNLVGGFVTYRLTRQHGRKRTEASPTDNSLIPSFASASGNTPAELHAALNGRNLNKSANDKRDKHVVYGEDWQIRAAARVMSILFTANNASASRRPDGYLSDERPGQRASGPGSRRGHMVSISAFYNTLLDYSDLVADFEAWESKAAKFSFCQYPFFLSIWAKIRILEHDARRQMEVKAREAFFNSILNRKAVSQYLVLKVRRDCLVEDSLRSVSEVVGSGQEETKKGLRIEFVGEEGVDAGGLRKEWFLLLVREVFDPHHGLFIYDDDSQYCYFNPYCFESSEQFFLVGVVLGLAIYNSTILDVALPPFAFKKLLTAAPPTTGGPQTSVSRTSFKSSLEDLAEYRPALARGLRALLEYDGDVKETFCYDFVAPIDRYGEVVEVPLCPGGEKRPVTNANRREFVDLYVHYLLDTAVARQFEPFKRGFFTVCGGNALSLFRPEEIELLVRGSDEPLDVATLRVVATYDNWSVANPESVPVVRWFWEFFGNANPQAQRKILSFITGSDRIPAMGATSLIIRLACLGDDSGRYPTARTCFNTLGLYRYGSREKLERMLWGAVVDSEGFGLK